MTCLLDRVIKLMNLKNEVLLITRNIPIYFATALNGECGKWAFHWLVVVEGLEIRRMCG